MILMHVMLQRNSINMAEDKQQNEKTKTEKKSKENYMQTST